MPLRLIPDLPSSPQGLKRYYACVGNKKATTLLARLHTGLRATEEAGALIEALRRTSLLYRVHLLSALREDETLQLGTIAGR